METSKAKWVGIFVLACFVIATFQVILNKVLWG